MTPVYFITQTELLMVFLLPVAGAVVSGFLMLAFSAWKLSDSSEK